MRESSVPIQWFPGHMAKTRRLITENLKLVDLIVELRDARIPASSANPEIARLAGTKPRVLLLTKSDLADTSQTMAWKSYYEKEGLPVLEVDCKTGKGVKEVPSFVKAAIPELLARRKARGMEGLPIRMMIVGVPNVGKSSLINRLSGGKPTKVEDRPGVTRSKQWIKVQKGLELLDTPGVLWPKFEDPLVGEKLAFTGAIKDQIMDTETLAAELLEILMSSYPALVEKRYRFAPQEAEEMKGWQLLELVGKKRGMLISGGEIDTERTANTVLDEFRSGLIGRITLESPHEK